MLFDDLAASVNLLKHQFGEVCLRFRQHPHLLQVTLQLFLWLLICRWQQLRNFGGATSLQDSLNTGRVKRLHHVTVELQPLIDFLDVTNIVLDGCRPLLLCR